MDCSEIILIRNLNLQGLLKNPVHSKENLYMPQKLANQLRSDKLFFDVFYRTVFTIETAKFYL